MTVTSFDTTKTRLENLLDQANTGELQLPDFQRGWIWDDERIKSLLASVSTSFPIGAVMLLQTGGVRFKPRPLEGTPESLQNGSPEALVLDGQQRLTSLYQVLKRKEPVKTKDAKGKSIYRWYYINMKQAIDPKADPEDTVLSVPYDRLIKSFGGKVTVDVATPEREYAEDFFPVNQIFDSAYWRQGYYQHWNNDPEKIDLFNEFERGVIKRSFEQYEVPVIKLGNGTPKEAVCLVFERVNTGGVPLTVFELLTASFAAEEDDFRLRAAWGKCEKELKRDYPVLRTLQSDDFLQAIALLVTQKRRRAVIDTGTTGDKAPGISCKRKDILNLKVADWKNWSDRVVAGFAHAARFLHEQKVFNARDLPYRTQLVPLAAIFTDLGREGEADGARQKIARWYWCGVLGELYGSAVESRFARDLPEVVDWVREGTAEPSTVQQSNFQANRLLTLRSRSSSAYKGLYALLMRDGCLDFRTGVQIEAQTFFEDKIDIHHIFPKKWCESQTVSIKPDFYNSVINRTAISAKTNRQISGRAPSIYLPDIEGTANIDPARMDKILTSHCIDPQFMRTDDFWGFYGVRAEALLRRIEKVTGKKIAREPGLFGPETVIESYDDGPMDWDIEEPLAAVAS